MFGEDITTEAGRQLLTQGVLGIMVILETAAIVFLVVWIRALLKDLMAEKDGRRADSERLGPIVQSVTSQLGANTVAYQSFTEYVKMQFEILRDRVSR